MILKTAANMQEHGYIEAGEEGGYYEVDGQRTEIGGGGDSRFSTCEVDVSFTLKGGKPLTITLADIYNFNAYQSGPVTAGEDLISLCYTSVAKVTPDSHIMTPLLFNGVAYIKDASGEIVNDKVSKYYRSNPNAVPVVTGDISIGTFNDQTVVVVRGNGTITFEMVED